MSPVTGLLFSVHTMFIHDFRNGGRSAGPDLLVWVAQVVCKLYNSRLNTFFWTRHEKFRMAGLYGDL